MKFRVETASYRIYDRDDWRVPAPYGRADEIVASYRKLGFDAKIFGKSESYGIPTTVIDVGGEGSVEINTVDDLTRFIKEFGDIIIHNMDNDEDIYITIYNGYVE